MSPAIRIGYATNVHPGRTLEQALTEIERHAPSVRELLVERGVVHAQEPLELGAWFSAESARALLARPGEVERVAERLRRSHLLIRSLNGFPYGHFHAERVKHAVYRPSWAGAERLLYTEALAEILARLLLFGGARAVGSISSVPIGWRSEVHAGGTGAALGAAVVNLRQMASTLARLEQRTGVRIRVDLEPEPGCFIDTSQGVVDFFDRHLAPRRGEIDPRRHLGVCHDVCHAAVMWESQRDAVERLLDARITIGRVQLSSALEWNPSRDAARVQAFNESRYLHQTTLRNANGAVHFFDDLPDALRSFHESPPDPSVVARTHLHVPLSSERAGELATTRSAVSDFFAAWPASSPLPPLEVETYTWEILPASMRPTSLAAGIAAEIEWAHLACGQREHGQRPGAPDEHPQREEPPHPRTPLEPPRGPHA